MKTVIWLKKDNHALYSIIRVNISEENLFTTFLLKYNGNSRQNMHVISL